MRCSAREIARENNAVQHWHHAIVFCDIPSGGALCMRNQGPPPPRDQTVTAKLFLVVARDSSSTGASRVRFRWPCIMSVARPRRVAGSERIDKVAVRRGRIATLLGERLCEQYGGG